MPFHTNSIGEFEFLEMRGTMHLRQEQLQLLEREGVDGSGVRKLGARGRPFELVTINYEDSHASAAAKMDQYKELPGTDPVEVIRLSVSEGTFLVLEVREADKFAIFNSLGGFNGGEECCHIVSWTLLG